MRAQVVHELGGAEQLAFEEVDDPTAASGEVLIGVEAIGLNFPDLLMIKGIYQYRPELPFVPGAEASGTVLEIGEGVDHVAVGDRVIGSNVTGAMAEQFVAPATNVFRLPHAVSMQHGACLAMAYGTSYHALVDRAHLQAGETLLITGASGGVGSAAIQIGKALDARVIAAVGSEEKVAVARALGADETINYSTESLKDRTKELTGGEGADVIYDPVGGDTFLECLRCINWKGRILVVGFASGDIPKAPMNLPLLKGCSIVGVFWGAFAGREAEKNAANFAQVFEWAVDGTISPHISATYSLADAPDALTALATRTATGKVVLTVP